MKPFRLQGLERLRERALREKRLALAMAAQACMGARQAVSRLEAQELACLEETARGLSSNVDVSVWSWMAEASRGGRARAATELDAAQESEAKAVADVVAARQELRVVERLRERRAEEARLEAARADERQLNDLNAGRHARRAARERDVA